MDSIVEIRSAAKTAIMYLASVYNISIRNYTESELDAVIFAYKLSSRTYHSHPHIRSMMATDTPELLSLLGAEKYNLSRQYQNLASFKHDLFQILVDGGAPKSYEWLFGDNEQEISITTERALVEKQHIVKRPSRIKPDIYKLVCDVFGFTDSKELSLIPGPGKQVGVNEFLSALETAYELEQKGCSYEQILVVTACIEATIPFQGAQRFYKLSERVKKVTEDFQLRAEGELDSFVDFVIYSAIDTANRDVANFEGRFAQFITNTKLLIPEMNPLIRQEAGVLSFRNSHEGSINFMSAIIAGHIEVFGSYKDFPGDDKLAERNSAARFNAQLGKDYLTVKYVSTTLLAAVATATSQSDAKLEDFVRGNGLLLSLASVSPKKALTDDEKVILSALKGEEMGVVRGFDIESSPIGYYIYKKLGSETALLYEDAKKCVVSNPIDAKNFLCQIREKIGVDNFNNILSVIGRGAGRNSARFEAVLNLSSEIAELSNSSLQP